MLKEMERNSHNLDDQPGSMLLGAPTFTTTLVDNGAPLSPRQRPVEDDSRRSSINGPPRTGGYFRPPAPPHMSQPPRRLAAAISGSGSPNSLRPQRDPQQAIPHPLSNLQSQSPPGQLGRRHTSADIRQPGWQINSPFYGGIGQNSHWPPSPSKHPNDYRDGGFDGPPHHQHGRSPFASQAPESTTNGNDAPTWSFGGVSRFPVTRESGHTAPPTRRSSVVSSSLHALLNPESTSERDGASDGEPDDRKRKRMV